MTEDIMRMAKAVDFAARAHAPQRRKGAAAEPYVNHLAEVALLVAEATQGADARPGDRGLSARHHRGLQGVAMKRLLAEFGKDVADLVREVTDDKNLSKAERKRAADRARPHASSRAKHLKLADKISNLNSILASPPADWSAERKREYFEWAAQGGRRLPRRQSLAGGALRRGLCPSARSWDERCRLIP